MGKWKVNWAVRIKIESMWGKGTAADGLCQVEAFGLATLGEQWGVLIWHTKGEGTSGRETSLEAVPVT